MKKLVLIFFLAISIPGLSQENFLAGTDWDAPSYVFENKDQESFSFTKPPHIDGQSFRWGYSILFHDDGTFNTNYSAPCGNDCFTSVNGTYSFIDDNVVVIYVESINRNGFCSLESEEPKTVYGKYKISFSDKGKTMKFTKVI